MFSKSYILVKYQALSNWMHLTFPIMIDWSGIDYCFITWRERVRRGTMHVLSHLWPDQDPTIYPWYIVTEKLPTRQVDRMSLETKPPIIRVTMSMSKHMEIITHQHEGVLEKSSGDQFCFRFSFGTVLQTLKVVIARRERKYQKEQN